MGFIDLHNLNEFDSHLLNIGEKRRYKFTIFGELGEGNHVILREGITSARWRTGHGQIICLQIWMVGRLQAGSARFGFHDPTPAKKNWPPILSFSDFEIKKMCIFATWQKPSETQWPSGPV